MLEKSSKNIFEMASNKNRTMKTGISFALLLLLCLKVYAQEHRTTGPFDQQLEDMNRLVAELTEKIETNKQEWEMKMKNAEIRLLRQDHLAQTIEIKRKSMAMTCLLLGVVALLFMVLMIVFIIQANSWKKKYR